MPQNVAHNLDDPSQYSRLDPSGLRHRIRELPRHCLMAWRKAQACPLPEGWTAVDRVVIGGMGGSAIAGDLAADLVAAHPAVPISVVRDLRFPFALDERTLFIASSYSGSTEETLSLFDRAIKSQAKVLAICSGGTLADRASHEGIPLLTIDIASEPRSVVGYNLMLLLGVLWRLGLISVAEEDVNRAVESLSRGTSNLGEDVPAGDNPAKQLALELRDKLILIYGSGVFSAVARRWKTQFNENAKAWAFYESIPEVLHNSVETYCSMSLAPDRIMGLLLQPDTSDGGHARHHSVVSELLRRNNIPHRILPGENGPPLAQLLGMLLLGDYVSYYLALLQEVDPSPNPAITVAKELLSNNG